MAKENGKVVMLPNRDVDERVIQRVLKTYSVVKAASISKNEEIEDEQINMEGQKANDLLQSLGANDTLKSMLATQMAAIHDLQQFEFVLAMKSTSPQIRQSHLNSVAKLSNVFIQQASLMQKLQGKGQQKVTVEHVHVHSGAQAIVGNIETNTGGRERD